MGKISGWISDLWCIAKHIRNFMTEIKSKARLYEFQHQWRSLNSHNGTIAMNVFPIERVVVGGGTYGFLHILAWDNPNEKLIIGSYCSLADVTFLLGGNHDYKRLTTFPYWSHILGKKSVEKTGTKGTIVVEDDVWIGHGAMIMSGVTIGKGAVIGTGSIVTKDVPPYAVYAGGRIIKYRFSEKVIEKIKSLDLSKIRNLSLDEQKKVLFSHVNENNIDEFLCIINNARDDF